ncbi:MAG: hypothetical protein ACM3JD_13920, partial [Rudaea sp.]
DVGQVVEPRWSQVQAPSYRQWRRLLEEKAIPSVVATEGMRVQVDELVLETLAPAEASDNANVALLLTASGHRLVLTSSLAAADLDAAALSDADWSGEIGALPRKFDPTLLNRIDPSTAILFAGEGSREQPSAEALALLQGRTLLRTDERGDIEVILDGPKVEVRTER